MQGNEVYTSVEIMDSHRNNTVWLRKLLFDLDLENPPLLILTLSAHASQTLTQAKKLCSVRIPGACVLEGILLRRIVVVSIVKLTPVKSAAAEQIRYHQTTDRRESRIIKKSSGQQG